MARTERGEVSGGRKAKRFSTVEGINERDNSFSHIKGSSKESFRPPNRSYSSQRSEAYGRFVRSLDVEYGVPKPRYFMPANVSGPYLTTMTGKSRLHWPNEWSRTPWLASSSSSRSSGTSDSTETYRLTNESSESTSLASSQESDGSSRFTFDYGSLDDETAGMYDDESTGTNGEQAYTFDESTTSSTYGDSFITDDNSFITDDETSRVYVPKNEYQGKNTVYRRNGSRGYSKDTCDSFGSGTKSHSQQRNATISSRASTVGSSCSSVRKNTSFSETSCSATGVNAQLPINEIAVGLPTQLSWMSKTYRSFDNYEVSRSKEDDKSDFASSSVLVDIAEGEWSDGRNYIRRSSDGKVENSENRNSGSSDSIKTGEQSRGLLSPNKNVKSKTEKNSPSVVTIALIPTSQAKETKPKQRQAKTEKELGFSDSQNRQKEGTICTDRSKPIADRSDKFQTLTNPAKSNNSSTTTKEITINNLTTLKSPGDGFNASQMPQETTRSLPLTTAINRNSRNTEKESSANQPEKEIASECKSASVDSFVEKNNTTRTLEMSQSVPWNWKEPSSTGFKAELNDKPEKASHVQRKASTSTEGISNDRNDRCIPGEMLKKDTILSSAEYSEDFLVDSDDGETGRKIKDEIPPTPKPPVIVKRACSTPDTRAVGKPSLDATGEMIQPFFRNEEDSWLLCMNAGLRPFKPCGKRTVSSYILSIKPAQTQFERAPVKENIPLNSFNDKYEGSENDETDGKHSNVSRTLISAKRIDFRNFATIQTAIEELVDLIDVESELSNFGFVLGVESDHLIAAGQLNGDCVSYKSMYAKVLFDSTHHERSSSINESGERNRVETTECYLAPNICDGAHKQQCTSQSERPIFTRQNQPCLFTTIEVAKRFGDFSRGQKMKWISSLMERVLLLFSYEIYTTDLPPLVLNRNTVTEGEIVRSANGVDVTSSNCEVECSVVGFQDETLEDAINAVISSEKLQTHNEDNAHQLTSKVHELYIEPGSFPCKAREREKVGDSCCDIVHSLTKASGNLPEPDLRDPLPDKSKPDNKDVASTVEEVDNFEKANLMDRKVVEMEQELVSSNDATEYSVQRSNNSKIRCGQSHEYLQSSEKGARSLSLSCTTLSAGNKEPSRVKNPNLSYQRGKKGLLKLSERVKGKKRNTTYASPQSHAFTVACESMSDVSSFHDMDDISSPGYAFDLLGLNKLVSSHREALQKKRILSSTRQSIGGLLVKVKRRQHDLGERQLKHKTNAIAVFKHGAFFFFVRAAKARTYFDAKPEPPELESKTSKISVALENNSSESVGGLVETLNKDFAPNFESSFPNEEVSISEGDSPSQFEALVDQIVAPLSDEETQHGSPNDICITMQAKSTAEIVEMPQRDYIEESARCEEDCFVSGFHESCDPRESLDIDAEAEALSQNESQEATSNLITGTKKNSVIITTRIQRGQDYWKLEEKERIYWLKSVVTRILRSFVLQLRPKKVFPLNFHRFSSDAGTVSTDEESISNASRNETTKLLEERTLAKKKDHPDSNVSLVARAKIADDARPNRTLSSDSERATSLENFFLSTSHKFPVHKTTTDMNDVRISKVELHLDQSSEENVDSLELVWKEQSESAKVKDVVIDQRDDAVITTAVAQLNDGEMDNIRDADSVKPKTEVMSFTEEKNLANTKEALGLDCTEANKNKNQVNVQLETPSRYGTHPSHSKAKVLRSIRARMQRKKKLKHTCERDSDADRCRRAKGNIPCKSLPVDFNLVQCHKSAGKDVLSPSTVRTCVPTSSIHEGPNEGFDDDCESLGNLATLQKEENIPAAADDDIEIELVLTGSSLPMHPESTTACDAPEDVKRSTTYPCEPPDALVQTAFRAVLEDGALGQSSTPKKNNLAEWVQLKFPVWYLKNQPLCDVGGCEMLQEREILSEMVSFMQQGEFEHRDEADKDGETKSNLPSDEMQGWSLAEELPTSLDGTRDIELVYVSRYGNHGGSENNLFNKKKTVRIIRGWYRMTRPLSRRRRKTNAFLQNNEDAKSKCETNLTAKEMQRKTSTNKSRDGGSGWPTAGKQTPHAIEICRVDAGQNDGKNNLGDEGQVCGRDERNKKKWGFRKSKIKRKQETTEPIARKTSQNMPPGYVIEATVEHC